MLGETPHSTQSASQTAWKKNPLSRFLTPPPPLFSLTNTLGISPLDSRLLGKTHLNSIINIFRACSFSVLFVIY